MWDTHTHVQLCALSGHQEEVRALAVHNENLYSGSEDASIKASYLSPYPYPCLYPYPYRYPYPYGYPYPYPSPYRYPYPYPYRYRCPYPYCP